MKAYSGVELYLHSFFDLSTKWSASRPGRFTSKKEPVVPIG
jgi:hypothetical protein